MKKATENFLRKMARSGYQEVREALEEIARLRALLREQLPDDPALDNDQHNRAPRSGDPG